MRFILTLLTFVSTAFLNAETIGNIEYILPNQANDWKVSHFENPSVTTSLYSSQDNQEQFVVTHSNGMSYEDFDEKTLIDSLKTGFEFGLQFANSKEVVEDVKADLLEKSHHSMTVKFCFTLSNSNVIGLVRILTNAHENVTLIYTTQELENEEDFSSWIEAIANVKFITEN